MEDNINTRLMQALANIPGIKIAGTRSVDNVDRGNCVYRTLTGILVGFDMVADGKVLGIPIDWKPVTTFDDVVTSLRRELYIPDRFDENFVQYMQEAVAAGDGRRAYDVVFVTKRFDYLKSLETLNGLIGFVPGLGDANPVLWFARVALYFGLGGIAKKF